MAVIAPAKRRASRAFTAAAALLALAAVAALVATRDTGAGLEAAALAERARPSVGQMLAESMRLKREGDAYPKFALPQAQSRQRQGELAERAIAGPHALDWRKGNPYPSTPKATEQKAYAPPPGPLDRVDDPVGDQDGWVRIGDSAFRVTRSRFWCPRLLCCLCSARPLHESDGRLCRLQRWGAGPPGRAGQRACPRGVGRLGGGHPRHSGARS